MRKPRGGYVPPEKKTRGIVLPVEVSDEFNRQAVHELSQEWLAAIVLWMAAKRFPRLQEFVFRAAKNLHIKEAIREVQEHLMDHVASDLIAEHVAGLPKAEQAKILAGKRR